jgi:molybdopterin molybdotransferase
MRVFLSLEEAWEETLRRIPVLGTEQVALQEAYGRVLAQTICSKRPYPPFDRSALDGYAVRAVDVVGATPSSPVVLDVIEEVGAGRVPERVVGAGQASRVMTGAPIPDGADAIVRLEGTERMADGKQVKILIEVPPGEAISVQGEDAPAGAPLLRPGVRIGAAETAVLAMNGEESVTVHRRPRVGLLVSGEEVRPLGVELEPGSLYDSNGPMLAALVRDGGGEPVPYGQVGDDLASTAAILRRMAEECDLVLTTGGVSVGDYDLMREAYLRAGGEILFWKVKIRPGTPVAFAQIGGTPVFGLSGNPAAAFVNYVLFVVPALKKLAGDPKPEHRPLRAVLGSQVEARTIGLDRFLRAHLHIQDGLVTTTVRSKGQKAGILTSLLGVHGLVRIPAHQKPRQGQLVNVYLLPGVGR